MGAVMEEGAEAGKLVAGGVGGSFAAGTLIVGAGEEVSSLGNEVAHPETNTVSNKAQLGRMKRFGARVLSFI
jgi:hypothetical protein